MDRYLFTWFIEIFATVCIIGNLVLAYKLFRTSRKNRKLQEEAEKKRIEPKVESLRREPLGPKGVTGLVGPVGPKALVVEPRDQVARRSELVDQILAKRTTPRQSHRTTYVPNNTSYRGTPVDELHNNILLNPNVYDSPVHHTTRSVEDCESPRNSHSRHDCEVRYEAPCTDVGSSSGDSGGSDY